MAKLVDALDLGSSGETHQSSSLCMPTISDIFTRITILPYGVCEAAQHKVLGKLVDALDLGATGKPIRGCRPVCPPFPTFFANDFIVFKTKKPTNVGFLF